MALLQEHPNIIMDESTDANEEKKDAPEEGAPTKVWGNLVAFVERLDDELFKSLQVSARVCLLKNIRGALKISRSAAAGA